ncbi:MAG: hypothetical protein WA962_13315 [Ornithinimicrobium sp.]
MCVDGGLQPSEVVAHDGPLVGGYAVTEVEQDLGNAFKELGVE